MPFHPKILRIFPLLALCLAAGLVHGQTTFTNPSFEGTPAAHTPPPGWTNCYGTPDILPGVWGVTLAPYNGSTYLGLVTSSGGYKEAVGQSFAFSGGVNYSLSLNLARSTAFTDPAYDPGGRLNVWAGSASCAKSQLLWQSPVVTYGWQNHSFNFVPNANYTHITLEAEYPGGAGYSHVLVDDLQIGCELPTTTPTAAASGTLATQGSTWSLDQPLNLLTNVAVTGVPAGGVKWEVEYRRNGQTSFKRVVENPAGYEFEMPGEVLLRPTYFCNDEAVNFAAPVPVTVTDGFNQKIQVIWWSAHIDIALVCDVIVMRGTRLLYKGTTSDRGKLYVEGLQNGDQIQVRLNRMQPYTTSYYNVTFSAEQADPILIYLWPDFVDLGL
jgi:hypothetical protein